MEDVPDEYPLIPPTRADTLKVQVIPGHTSPSATFLIANADHTLGNDLRWVLAKNPEVEFMGYTMPHPIEPLRKLRLQTYERPAEELLDEGLNSLVLIAEDLQKKWLKAVSKARLA